MNSSQLFNKTQNGLSIYAHILKKRYSDVAFVTDDGQNYELIANPLNQDKKTLILSFEQNLTQHSDFENAIPSGDALDFACLHYKCTRDEAISILSAELNIEVLLPPTSEEISHTNSMQQIEILCTGAAISFFRRPIKNIVPSEKLSIREIHQAITQDFQQETTHLRAITNTADAKKYKAANFDYVTFSGLFAKRSNRDLIEHSGLMVIDFDNLKDIEACKRQLMSDHSLETVLLFTSPSGNGLKWVLEVDLCSHSHEQFFTAVSNYIKSTYNLETDKSGKDVSRACFLCHDPNCYINPKYI